MATTNSKRVLWVAESALLLALIVVAQLLTFVFPKTVPLVGQLVTGSLVNLILIAGAGTVGFAGTAVAAILSPVLAFAMAQMPFPPMVPVIALGNLVIVAVVWAFFSKNPNRSKGIGPDIGGVAAGAVLKTAFLWAATNLIVIPVFFSGKGVANPAAIQKIQMVSAKLTLMFSWPQLLTALIGGAVALAIIPAIRKARKSSNT